MGVSFSLLGDFGEFFECVRFKVQFAFNEGNPVDIPTFLLECRREAILDARRVLSEEQFLEDISSKHVRRGSNFMNKDWFEVAEQYAVRENNSLA